MQCFFYYYFRHQFYFPAYLAGGSTLSDLFLDKPWSQVSSLVPPDTYLTFIVHMVQHSHSTVRRFSWSVAHTHALAFSADIQFVWEGKQQSVPTSMNSVRLEPTNLILVGTQTTYKSHRGRRLVRGPSIDAKQRHGKVIDIYYYDCLLTI